MFCMYVSLQKRTCNYFCIFQFSTGVYLLQRDICVFEAVDQPLLCVTKAVPVPYQVQDVCFTVLTSIDFFLYVYCIAQLYNIDFNDE